jgi:hypothetical protein
MARTDVALNNALRDLGCFLVGHPQTSPESLPTMGR